jgi:hypothetical protein
MTRTAKKAIGWMVEDTPRKYMYWYYTTNEDTTYLGFLFHLVLLHGTVWETRALPCLGNPILGVF